MRITKEADERKNEILDQAEILFTAKGYSKATINDILTKVKIAKGTFYYYFKSKEEVMDAIVMRYIKTGVDVAKAIVDNPKLTVYEKVFGIMMAQKPNSKDTSGKEQIIEQLHQVQNAEMHQKSLVETVLQLTPVLTEVVEQGIQEGLFNTPYPKETVEFILVAASFIFDEGLFSSTPAEMATKIQAFVHTIQIVLGAEKGSFMFVTQLILNQ